MHETGRKRQLTYRIGDRRTSLIAIFRALYIYTYLFEFCRLHPPVRGSDRGHRSPLYVDIHIVVIFINKNDRDSRIRIFKCFRSHGLSPT